MSIAHTEETKRAREYAVKAHGGQKYGEKPYVYHLDAVATLAHITLPDDEDVVVVAYLHDVPEDTPITLLDLMQAFGRVNAEAVGYVTDEPGKNRRERKAATHAKLAKVDEWSESGAMALLVKLCDRVVNVRECVVGGNAGLLDMYRKEQEAFHKAVSRKDWHASHEVLWAELEELLARKDA